jgi:putative ABC transport system permease protein
MALGATARDVLRLIVASGVKLAATGIVLGLGASFFLMRFIRHLLFGVTTTDPITMLIVSAALFSAASAASYLPARRAARMDPLASIRHE